MSQDRDPPGLMHQIYALFKSELSTLDKGGPAPGYILLERLVYGRSISTFNERLGHVRPAYRAVARDFGYLRPGDVYTEIPQFADHLLAPVTAAILQHAQFFQQNRVFVIE